MGDKGCLLVHHSFGFKQRPLEDAGIYINWVQDFSEQTLAAQMARIPRTSSE